MPHLLQEIRLLDGFQDVLLRRLLSLAAQQELVQDEIRLLEVKDDVQLADLRLGGTITVIGFAVFGNKLRRRPFSATRLTLPKYLSSSST